MKSNKNVRVRFAPSPTGIMHLGNIRTALMNYLFANQHKGAFILRIEDTDPNRIFDPNALKILNDLEWLGLTFDEGPGKHTEYGPYFQSERTEKYEKKLQELIDKDLAYRCFCTQQELEKKRKRQIALKLPPRYDRACTQLTKQQIEQNLKKGRPFIWRIKLVPQILEVTDRGKGTVSFDMSHFSDFPITRQDGTFTFMFANFVDDLLMDISHVMRGEDHLTNTAGQAALYKAFNTKTPIFWHMPILCNKEGKKLSKRDFGFALASLREQGYLPEAILNYLALIGGGSFDNEIMSLDELVKAIDFNQMHSGGQVKYDLEKLNWINKKWIERIELDDLVTRALPFLEQDYPAVRTLDSDALRNLVAFVRNEAVTLANFTKLLRFYFLPPDIAHADLKEHVAETSIQTIEKLLGSTQFDDADHFIKTLKEHAKKENIPLKDIYTYVRFTLIGSTQGPSIKDIILLLGPKETEKRIHRVTD